MTPEQAPLSTADFVKTPETVRAEEVRREREELVVPAAQAAAEGVTVRTEEPAALFPDNEATDLRRRWTDVQTSFVDEPRRAVEQADGLVAAVMKRLAESFAGERANLERQWDRGTDVTTEDLRVAMQRYRSFFDRLLSI